MISVQTDFSKELKSINTKLSIKTFDSLKERRRMKLKALTTAMILATVPMTGAFAAALDRSGQSISAFLQPGNYFEAGISVFNPSVSGKANAGYTPNAAIPSFSWS